MFTRRMHPYISEQCVTTNFLVTMIFFSTNDPPQDDDYKHLQVEVGENVGQNNLIQK